MNNFLLIRKTNKLHIERKNDRLPKLSRINGCIFFICIMTKNFLVMIQIKNIQEINEITKLDKKTINQEQFCFINKMIKMNEN